MIILKLKMKFIKQIYSTFPIPCAKSKIVSLTSSIMKEIVAFLTHSRFPVKLICCITFGSALSTCHLLKSIAISLWYSLKYA